jgi:FkbM family methyltransferase
MMRLKDLTVRALDAVKAMAAWPRFSVTSYVMISDLVRQGVLPRIVIDVGANVGQFAVASAKLFPGVLVHSFEPHPDCVLQLRRNVQSLGNVAVYPVAIGEKEGEIDFHLNAHSHSSSVLALGENHQKAFPEAREVSTIRVRMTTLDQILANVALSGPVLLKLDVQGYEAQVLRGCPELLQRVDYLVVEVSFKPMYQGETLFMDIVRMVDTFGFHFLRPVGWLTDSRTGEIIQMDALFARDCRLPAE